MNARLTASLATIICVFSLAARAGQVIESVEVVEGPTPFISFVHAHVSDLAHFEFVQFLIRPKTKSATRPVKVRYARSYLEARGYLDLQHSAVTIPVFGLYAGRTNRVTITFGFSIGFRKNTQLDIAIATPNYDGGTYSNPTVIQRLVSQQRLRLPQL